MYSVRVGEFLIEKQIVEKDQLTCHEMCLDISVLRFKKGKLMFI